MRQSEPPSPRRAATSSLFRVGRDSRGHWVAQDQRGLCGGLFVDRSKAIRFALEEAGQRPDAVIEVPGIVELDMSGTAATAPRRTMDSDSPRERRVA